MIDPHAQKGLKMSDPVISCLSCSAGKLTEMLAHTADPRHREINLSQIFAGQKVGIKQVMRPASGYFDDTDCRIEPLRTVRAKSVTHVSGIVPDSCLRYRPNQDGAPDRIRTCDLCLRRAALYPAELRVHLKSGRHIAEALGAPQPVPSGFRQGRKLAAGFRPPSSSLRLASVVAAGGYRPHRNLAGDRSCPSCPIAKFPAPPACRALTR